MQAYLIDMIGLIALEQAGDTVKKIAEKQANGMGRGAGPFLSPYKTISCLIGIGCGYQTTKVGATCQVCSKKDECPMRKNAGPDGKLT